MSIQFVLALLVLAWLLTWAVRVYALSRHIIDVPNERSSHSVPTPRGGGVAVVIVFLLATIYFLAAKLIDLRLFAAFFGAGLAIAVLGFLDDHGHIPAKWRLLCHFVIAGWVLACLGAFPPLILFGNEYHLGWIGNVLVIFYLVWLTNLYNFMDGIDGLASVEAITSLLAACVIYYLIDLPSLMVLPLSLAAAVSGFLIWNFPPARIFMGDSGSGFLGVILGVISLVGTLSNPNLFFSWLILLGVFIVDATITLLHRLVRGEKFYEAHRSHAYQRAARKYRQHRSVTIGVFVINVIWLAPLAYMVAASVMDGVLGVTLAYAPLVLLALKYGAGKGESC